MTIKKDAPIREHFALLGTDEDKPVEDLVASLLGVLSYSLQAFKLRPHDSRKTLRHMQSEYLRIAEKAA